MPRVARDPLTHQVQTMRNSRVKLLLFASLFAVAGTVQADLPDFTGLVERNAPAVVNITARKDATAGTDPSELYDEEVPEIFRRFFGPGHPPIGGEERLSGGSGFIISADGYLLTNHHVVEGADEITVRLKDRRQLKARIIGSDPQSDIALLKLDAKNLPTVTLGDSGALKPGQWVVAIGSPFNFDYSVTAGIVSAKGRSVGGGDQRFVPFIQTDVAINRGNSGGPLFNLDGEVVGINSQIFSNTGGYIGLSFAIPIEVAKSVVQQLKTKGRVSRGSLGVQIQEVTADNAEALGLPRVGGALIASVVKGSAAERAGLKVGDLIVSYNGVEIGSSAELPPMVGATAPGSKASVGIVRDGREMTIPVTVGELPAEATTASVQPSTRARKTDNPLGVVVRELSGEEREQLGLESNEGVLVERVTGAEARRAGLQPGAIVLRVGRDRVGSVEQFDSALKGVEPGAVTMMLVRQGENTGFITIRRPAAKG
jgi:serine protease Do